MKSKLSLLFAMLFTSLYTVFALAQAAAPSPVPSASPVAVAAPVVAAPAGALSPGDFLSQVLAAIQGFGGLSTMLKISAIIALIIASMKVSYLNTLVWSKLGAAQAYVAPVLGLIAGVLGLGAGGAPITLASVFAYVTAGAGAVALHEFLDTLKAIPGLGSIYLTVIGLIEGALGGPSSAVAQAAGTPASTPPPGSKS